MIVLPGVTIGGRSTVAAGAGRLTEATSVDDAVRCAYLSVGPEVH